jgi:hypothetical protein
MTGLGPRRRSRHGVHLHKAEFTLAAALVAIAPGSAAAVTYYVSTSGVDTNAVTLQSLGAGEEELPDCSP